MLKFAHNEKEIKAKRFRYKKYNPKEHSAATNRQLNREIREKEYEEYGDPEWEASH